MKNIVTYEKPTLRPMPGELTTDRINGATLPVKIEAMSNAIRACGDLPELMTYRRPVDALAAAAKALKDTMPRAAMDMNRVAKQLVLRMGELLLQYSHESVIHTRSANGRAQGRTTSDRTKVAREVGIKPTVLSQIVRFARAPKDIQERVLNTDAISSNPVVMARNAPRQNIGGKAFSDIAREIFSGHTKQSFLTTAVGNRGGLAGASRNLKGVPLDKISQLTSEEKITARKLIVEMQEILDAMMQRLGE